MTSKLTFLISLIVLSSFLSVAGNAFAKSKFGDNVNALCAPQLPYTGDCALCHVSQKSTPTPAKTAYLAGGFTLINFFCPAPPVITCTDKDADTFAIEGGNCGQIDCNDNSATVYPGAPEICGDGIDQDCNGTDINCIIIPPLLHLLGTGK